MSMVVQHNMQAMNSNRMLGITTSSQAKSTEKLSSGYKINRAADDAAGLTISEKMRKQMRGLDRASTNAEDGVSAVQTAEGALTEVHSMLQRMNELAVQAANGTNSESDRDAIQAEIDQLTTEIDRVSETTKFNEMYLLKGDTGIKEVNVNAHDAGIKGTLTDNGNGTSTFALDKALEDGDTITIAGQTYTIGSKEANTDGFEEDSALTSKAVSAGDSITYTDSSTGKEVTKTLVEKAIVSSGGYSLQTDDKVMIDGKEYTIASATSLDDSELNATDAELLINQALIDGKSVELTELKTGTGIYDDGTVKVQIVAELDDSEISSLTGISATTKGAPIAGDLAAGVSTTVASGTVVTISGVSYEATDETPAAMSAVQDVIKAMQGDETTPANGDTVTIDGNTYIVGEGNGYYSVDQILSVLNDKSTVQFGSTNVSSSMSAALSVAGLTAGSDYTAVEKKSVGDDGNVISKSEAYSMITEELAKASSIGTDKDHAATVTSNNAGSFTIKQGTVSVANTLSFNLHVGSDADMTNKIQVDIHSMDAAYLGVKGLDVVGDGNDGGIAATYAIDAISDAISKVSAQRSALGAIQNRLEHTIANLDNVVENTTSAESRIRDTDMAEEMVEYSKNNILAQAGQSMLAQANQSTQGVLSLLG